MLPVQVPLPDVGRDFSLRVRLDDRSLQKRRVRRRRRRSVRDARLRLARAADGRRRSTRRRHWRHADLFSFHDLSKLAFKIVRLKKKFLQLTNHFRQAVGVEIG